MADAKILVIDDEAVIREMTAIILKGHGYDVLVAPDAAAGMDLVSTAAPDLVLLDYMMPGMDGLAALKLIRGSYPDCYVIMFTGKGNQELAVTLMKAGASDYVLKPYNNHDLLERIENVLRIRAVEMDNRQLMQDKERLLEEIALWNYELEQRVDEKTAALRRFQAEFVQSEKLAALGYLSAGMAHEIRNPLNSISLLVQLLQETITEEERCEYGAKILKEICRIDDLLGKLLHASKGPRTHIQDVSIAAVLQTALEVFKPQTDLNSIMVTVDYIAVPPPIQADPTELEHVFTNLFANAINEMPGRGTLRVQLDHDDEQIFVRVSDTGRGIRPEHLSSIFDPFFSTKHGGSGMGLAYVRRIVKTHHGKIEVEKSDGSGTTFCLKFPMPIA